MSWDFLRNCNRTQDLLWKCQSKQDHRGNLTKNPVWHESHINRAWDRIE